ncbi:hypothetical protein C0U41_29780, partial [Klebsiella pneumoniae]
RNEVVLHSDPRWLPERQRAWASWNYRLSDGDWPGPSATRWCCTAIRAGCRSASAPGPAGTIA